MKTVKNTDYKAFNEPSEYVCMDEKFILFLLCLFISAGDWTHFSLANTVLKIRNK